MRLAGIHPGDIVRADGMHAVVLRKERRALLVQAISGAGIRRLRADELDAHWRRTGWRRATVPPAPRRDQEVTA